MRHHLSAAALGDFFSNGYFTLKDGICFFSFFAVPASVQGIIADNVYSSHSLIVRWQKAVGVSERYDILLLSENGILLSNTSKPAATKQHKFEDLTPGKNYKIQVLTVSGGLFSKEAQTEGRTGNSHRLLLCVRSLLVCYSLEQSPQRDKETGRLHIFLDTVGTSSLLDRLHIYWPMDTASPPYPNLDFSSKLALFVPYGCSNKLSQT